MSYDDHEAAGNTVAWGFGDASPAPGGKWGGDWNHFRLRFKAAPVASRDGA